MSAWNHGCASRVVWNHNQLFCKASDGVLALSFLVVRNEEALALMGWILVHASLCPGVTTAVAVKERNSKTPEVLKYFMFLSNTFLCHTSTSYKDTERSPARKAKKDKRFSTLERFGSRAKQRKIC